MYKYNHTSRATVLNPLGLIHTSPLGIPTSRPIKHPRYPRMTIAAGFLCKEGVLICADTQHTAGMKLHRSKVGDCTFPGGKLAWAYAGHETFALAAIGKVEKLLESGCSTDPLADIEKILDKEYRRNVLRHPSLQIDGALQYRFILGLWLEQTHVAKLYVSTQTAIAEVNEYECIGEGDYLAHYLLRPSFLKGLPERQTLGIAAYALSAIKDYVDGCGGMSIYTVLHNNGQIGLVTSEHDGPMRELEKYSATYDFVTRELLTALVDEDSEDDDFEHYLMNTFKPRLMKVREEWSTYRKKKEQEFAVANPHLGPKEAKQLFRQLSMGIRPNQPPSQG